MRTALLRVAGLLAATLPSALAADPFYLGAWKVASSVVAPWAEPSARKPDEKEAKSLIGKTIVIRANSIEGPGIFACKGPRYKVVDYPADWLFQGSFGERHAKDASVDPGKLAAKLGFQGKSWKTLETGCGNELDYHFVNPTTAEFGLNDFVYTLKKE